MIKNRLDHPTGGITLTVGPFDTFPPGTRIRVTGSDAPADKDGDYEVVLTYNDRMLIKPVPSQRRRWWLWFLVIVLLVVFTSPLLWTLFLIVYGS